MGYTYSYEIEVLVASWGKGDKVQDPAKVDCLTALPNLSAGPVKGLHFLHKVKTEIYHPAKRLKARFASLGKSRGTQTLNLDSY